MQYPFMIMNTDKDNKKGTHWWSLLELHFHHDIFLFDGFGCTGFKEFIIDNNCKIIWKIIYGLKKSNKKDNKITLVSLTFSVEVYEKLSSQKTRLLTRAQDSFYVINEFAKAHNLKTVKLYLVDDTFQGSKYDTCGFFLVYFYTNLFLKVKF